jgi:pimeloyl-ACP methyl ester carboxylesterase
MAPAPARAVTPAGADARLTSACEYRCIGYDLRTSTGLSAGPLEVDRPWDMLADDQIALMDHLKIDKFMVMGFCIGGPLIWNLLERAPDRVVAAVLAQPSGCREENPLLLFDNNMQGGDRSTSSATPA